MPDKELTEPKAARILYPDAAEDERPLYANLINVNFTPWDFALHFGHVVLPNPSPSLDRTEPVDIKAKRVATISIPPTLIRSLITALQTTLDSYEHLYGKIEIPQKDEEGS
jgi:hypothetical protein